MTLHELLNKVNGKEITKIGGKTWYKAYDKLVDIIYALGEFTNLDLGNIVALMDEVDTNRDLY